MMYLLHLIMMILLLQDFSGISNHECLEGLQTNEFFYEMSIVSVALGCFVCYKPKWFCSVYCSYLCGMLSMLKAYLMRSLSKYRDLGEVWHISIIWFKSQRT